MSKRIISDEKREFNPAWTESYLFVQVDGKPVCLQCNESVGVFKKCNLERHYKTKHAQDYDKVVGKSRIDLINKLKTKARTSTKYVQKTKS